MLGIALHVAPLCKQNPAVLSACDDTALWFAQKRSGVRAQREKENREAESQFTVAGPKGDTEWERAVDYVNFGFTRPNGSDLSRMKSLLFSAKNKSAPGKA